MARRSIAFVFCLVHLLLTMIILATAVEGWVLSRWGKWQPQFQKLREFPNPKEIIVFEVIQALLFLAMVLVSAMVLRTVSQTFEIRRTYRQAFTTMAYGFSPSVLVRVLDAAPMMNPWVPWVFRSLMLVRCLDFVSRHPARDAA